ncbi:MAG: group III truncated hemoglobin [Gemmobacter sp.]|uniref:group III truncated hemoglobin n=1 Tax=Gemmobacter sp. TaxID=1898957 RepID=UPI00391A320B
MTAPDTLRSAHPAVTADLMARTGLDDATLKRLVHGVYDRVRRDPLLGPVFAGRITDWGPHPEKMVDFWSSVALMTGRYHGAPMPKHLPLPVEREHFDRWLDIFRQTADEVCPPAGAAWVIDRAERIAASIHMNIMDARGDYGRASHPPRL